MNSPENIDKFYDDVCSLQYQYANRDLEEYLLALYGLVLAKREEEPTLTLFVELLSDAFIAEPYPFDGKWLKQVKEPDDDESGDPIKQFQYTFDVITFQVAELHKMIGKQLLDPQRYMVISSETNHRWANLDPYTNLDCGIGWMTDIGYSLTETSWATLGILLERGREYE